MKKILMIATGGTIASKDGGEGLSPAMSATELLECVPELKDVCEITAVQPFNLDSTNLFEKHWLEMVRIIEENYERFDGFVLTHGTDTMAYTAAALSYLVQNSEKPIVLTGSQKSAYLRDTDARKNLYDAFVYCADNGAQGVKIVFDGKVILGTRAKKTRTRSYNAFSSIDFPEIALVREGKVLYYLHEEKPTGGVKFYRALNPNVFLLKMIPGQSSEIFTYLAERYDGVLIESFGSGGLPSYENDECLSRFQELAQKGTTVVVGTQVEREGSALDTYEVGRRLLGFGNVLESRSMTPEATVVKLMWILAQTRDFSEVKRLFFTPVSKDIIW